MAYHIPYPKQAPWFIYGPYLAPDGLWRVGYVVANGQLHLGNGPGDYSEAFKTRAGAIACFEANDYGLEHSNATE